MQSYLIGKKAEAAACAFLQAKGLKLITQNYSSYRGEIDLIMQDQEDIVFVEVRCRAHEDYGSALETINQRKINNLAKTAVHFLQTKKWLYTKNSRFDVVIVRFLAGDTDLEWIKNAFTIDN